MYYSIFKHVRAITAKRLTALLFFSVSLFAFQSIIFASILDDSIGSYRTKGYEEQQKGNFDKSLEYYTKALSLGANDAVIYNDIGITYEHLGLTNQAVANYLKAIELNQDYLPPYTNLAYLYEEHGEIAKSIEYFRQRYDRASSNDPWKERIKAKLRSLNPNIEKEIIQRELEEFEEEQKQKARDEFTLAIERSENHYKSGQDYLMSARFHEAIEEFDRALAITPNNPKILRARNLVIYEQRVDDVKRRTNTALQLIENGELKSAKEEYQKILATIPDKPFQESK